MSVVFPSSEFFERLQQGLEEHPSSTADVEPSEAYCGFAIDDHLYVFEFEGKTCAGTIAGGNEIDLDFVLSGPLEVWARSLEALAAGEVADDDESSLQSLIKQGSLELRSQEDGGVEAGMATLPFLQVFLGESRGFEWETD